MTKGLDSICWKCVNALGDCNWSECFKPVKGWQIEKSKIYAEGVQVINCPKFKIDIKEKRNNSINEK